MASETQFDRYELDEETEPVMEVNEVGIGAVDVRTLNGFVFRFQRMAGGYSFDDGYLPGEDPSTDDPSRSWVFSTDEVPKYVIEYLEDLGYEYTGKSAGPRATLVDEDPDQSWRERAEKYATV